MVSDYQRAYCSVMFIWRAAQSVIFFFFFVFMIFFGPLSMIGMVYIGYWISSLLVIFALIVISTEIINYGCFSTFTLYS